MSTPLRRRLAAWAIVAIGSLAACGKPAAEPPQPPPEVPTHVPWEQQVIYFVMTDRFANGDPSNDDHGMGEFDPSDGARYSGGDLQGIIDKVDYIQGLGATAVWITPPVANMWWDPLQNYGGYHGYWARHLEKIDEHLGTTDTYKALADALHARGMFLIQDVVPNHLGNFFQYSSYDPADPTRGFVKNTGAVPTSKPEQAPFDQNDVTDPAQREAAIYHWTPAISDYLDPHQEDNFQISDLDDLNTENEVVRRALRRSYGHWIREVGVDAFRVDTAKFVPLDFWRDFFHSEDPDAPGMHAVARDLGRDRFFAFGEIYETSPALEDAADEKVGSFHGTPDAPVFPAVIQFPLFEEIGRVFAGGKPTGYLRYRLERFMDPSLYPNPNTTPTFVDNHDVRRFLQVGTGEGLVQALGFIFTIPGIPIVYYGTEQALKETRASLFAGGYGSGGVDRYSTTSGLYTRIQKLADVRRSHPVFTRGTLEVIAANEAGSGLFAYRRRLEGETALVILNTADERVLVTGLDTGLPAGAVLQTLHAELGAPLPKVDASGQVQLVLPRRSFLIARATGATEEPQPPAATIAVATEIEGQTFTDDVAFSGTISPAANTLQMVVDGYLDKATSVTVAADGSWSIVLPVSSFPEGVEKHSVAFYSPSAKVASRSFAFTTDVAFEGEVLEVPDPGGDDAGPAGTYTYPTDSTFRDQMDVTGVRLEIGVTTLNLKITMADWSTVWNPPNGFDHVAFNVYFELPGAALTNVMPRLNATTPDGFGWRYAHFAFGWENAMYTSDGATATSYGAPARAPGIATNPTAKTVIFKYDRNDLGLSSWSGVRVYIATWDYDGIEGKFRSLTPAGGPWTMGGGAETDPMIMDDVAPIAIP